MKLFSHLSNTMGPPTPLNISFSGIIHDLRNLARIRNVMNLQDYTLLSTVCDLR